MNTLQLLSQKRAEILRIASQYGASNIRVFGSVARQEDDSDSDIDLLIDLEKGRTLVDHAAFKLDLEGLLGKKVDVISSRGIKLRIKDRVLKEAIPL